MTRWLLGSVAAFTLATAWSAGSVVDGMNASVPCQACHKSVAGDNFVFTLSKLRE